MAVFNFRLNTMPGKSCLCGKMHPGQGVDLDTVHCVPGRRLRDPRDRNEHFCLSAHELHYKFPVNLVYMKNN